MSAVRVATVAIVLVVSLGCGRYGPPRRVPAEPAPQTVEEPAGEQPADSKADDASSTKKNDAPQ